MLEVLGAINDVSDVSLNSTGLKSSTIQILTPSSDQLDDDIIVG